MRYGQEGKTQRKTKKLFVLIRTKRTPEEKAELEMKIKLAKAKQ
jgi:hypothetical protein